MRPGALVLTTPEELRELVAEAVRGELAKAVPRAEQGDVMTCEQVAELLGIHVVSVRNLVRLKGLPELGRIGTHRRFSRAAVLAWLDQRRSA